MSKKKKITIEYAPGFWKSMNKCFSNHPRYWIPRTISNIKLEIVMAWERVFKGFDRRWYWNADYMICKTLIPTLKWLKKNGCSYPTYLKNITEWRKILGEIIKGFEAAQKIMDLSYTLNKNRYKKLEKEFRDGMKLFAKWFFNLWN